MHISGYANFLGLRISAQVHSSYFHTHNPLNYNVTVLSIVHPDYFTVWHIYSIIWQIRNYIVQYNFMVFVSFMNNLSSWMSCNGFFFDNSFPNWIVKNIQLLLQKSFQNWMVFNVWNLCRELFSFVMFVSYLAWRLQYTCSLW